MQLSDLLTPGSQCSHRQWAPQGHAWGVKLAMKVHNVAIGAHSL